MSFTRDLVNRSLPNVSVRNQSLLSRMVQGVSPTTQSLASMGSNGTLFAIVDALAQGVANAEWKLYRKNADGRRVYEGQETRVEVTRHAALDLWNRPNEFYTRQELVESFQQHYELTGEGWLFVSRNEAFPGLGPDALWPVRPDKMRPVPHRTKYLAGYIYTGPDGEDVPLDLDEIMFMRRPNPLDPYRGMGPVQTVLASIDSTRYSAEWNRNFFLNGAEPGGIIEVDRRLSDDEFTEMQQRWNEQHRGVRNAHRVAIIEHGKWVDRKYSQRDMQFAELITVDRETIRGAYRFPKPMLGAVDDINRANAVAGEVVFSRWLIKPRLERVKQMLNYEFLPMFGTTGKGLEFDFIDPTPEDREGDAAHLSSQIEAYTKLLASGVNPEDAAMVAQLPEMRVGGDNGSTEAE